MPQALRRALERTNVVDIKQLYREHRKVRQRLQDINCNDYTRHKIQRREVSSSKECGHYVMSKFRFVNEIEPATPPSVEIPTPMFSCPVEPSTTS